jgi:hypothetical protein
MPEDVFNKELKNESFKVNAVEIPGLLKDVRPFVDVLIEGVKTKLHISNPPEDDIRGWKLMSADVVKRILPDLQSMMAVYIADERGTIGPDMKAEMGRQKDGGTYSDVSVAAAPSSDLELAEVPRSSRGHTV